MTTSPLPSNTRCVVSAYVVLVALVLVYVVVMAARLARVERELTALDSIADKGPRDDERPQPAGTAWRTPPPG